MGYMMGNVNKILEYDEKCAIKHSSKCQSSYYLCNFLIVWFARHIDLAAYNAWVIQQERNSNKSRIHGSHNHLPTYNNRYKPLALEHHTIPHHNLDILGP